MTQIIYVSTMNSAAVDIAIKASKALPSILLQFATIGNKEFEVTSKFILDYTKPPKAF